MLTAVVDTRSVNGAAEVLYMSQSGVSRAVARLEARPIWCATAIQLPPPNWKMDSTAASGSANR
ncbi:LysR family transcriptional regulator [Janthinobacterium sp. S3M3]|uniref:helix-turn-helix domain-containing protein n=1 Tax=Janthinobacterium sp. S3M3 TaxID=2723078 RepID=UPI003907F497